MAWVPLLLIVGTHFDPGFCACDTYLYRGLFCSHYPLLRVVPRGHTSLHRQTCCLGPHYKGCCKDRGCLDRHTDPGHRTILRGSVYPARQCYTDRDYHNRLAYPQDQAPDIDRVVPDCYTAQDCPDRQVKHCLPEKYPTLKFADSVLYSVNLTLYFDCEQDCHPDLLTYAVLLIFNYSLSDMGNIPHIGTRKEGTMCVHRILLSSYETI